MSKPGEATMPVNFVIKQTFSPATSAGDVTPVWIVHNHLASSSRMVVVPSLEGRPPLAESVRREDPYGSFNFLVEIDGVDVAAFSEASGLDSTVDVIEYRNGSDDFTVRKLPGLKKYTNLVLKRGLTGDRSLWEWYKAVLDGQMEQRSVTVTILDETRQPAARFTFRDAWPCRWSGPHFDAGRSAVAIETLEICHEGIEFE